MEYYVYEHWRPDTNTCFYVGKGKNKRAWDMKNMRNCHHKAIVSKLISMGLSVDVRIIVKNISSETAINLEIDRISFYGIENLSNMTYGGEGLSLPSSEVRKKISESQIKRFKDPEQLRLASERSKGRIPYNKGKNAEELGLKKWNHSSETIQKLKEFAKKRGVSQKCREAQKMAVTGKKRAPFSQETIVKMKIAAKEREAKKRLFKEAI
jgi:hypothetical protein